MDRQLARMAMELSDQIDRFHDLLWNLFADEFIDLLDEKGYQADTQSVDDLPF